MQEQANNIAQYAGLFAAFMSVIATACAAYTAYIAPISAAKLAEKLRRDNLSVERKIDCLRRIAGYRSVPANSQWVAALNEVFVTFNDSPEVISCFVKLNRTIKRTGKKDVSEILDLIKAMMRNLGLSINDIDDDVMLIAISVAK